MNRKTPRRAPATVANCRWSKRLYSSVAKKLSHIALSYASPTEPIDCTMPVFGHRWPNPNDLYCEP